MTASRIASLDFYVKPEGAIIWYFVIKTVREVQGGQIFDPVYSFSWAVKQ